MLDAEKLLNQTLTPGVLHYCKVHEENIAGDTPFAQIAIEYEIETLPLRYGEPAFYRPGILYESGKTGADNGGDKRVLS